LSTGGFGFLVLEDHHFVKQPSFQLAHERMYSAQALN
jgi:hypothetical protein